MLTADSALQHTCSIIGEQAAHGDITAAERDLLIDGAILLAANLETLIQDDHADRPPAWPEASQRPARPARPARHARHARHALAASGAR